MIGAVRLLNLETQEKFRNVINSAANTPDKADLLRTYQYIWTGLPNFTSENLSKTIDSFTTQCEESYRGLMEQLNLLGIQLGRASGPANPADIWWDDIKEKCLDSDYLY